jgi:hypothetical protein
MSGIRTRDLRGERHHSDSQSFCRKPTLSKTVAVSHEEQVRLGFELRDLRGERHHSDSWSFCRKPTLSRELPSITWGLGPTRIWTWGLGGSLHCTFWEAWCWMEQNQSYGTLPWLQCCWINCISTCCWLKTFHVSGVPVCHRYFCKQKLHNLFNSSEKRLFPRSISTICFWVARHLTLSIGHFVIWKTITKQDVTCHLHSVMFYCTVSLPSCD